MKANELLKIKLKELNLQQEWIAEQLGVSQPSVSRALNGESDKLLNQIIAFLLREFPNRLKFTDFYPDYDPKRLDFLEERMSKLEKSNVDILEKMKQLLGKLDKLDH